MASKLFVVCHKCMYPYVEEYINSFINTLNANLLMIDDNIFLFNNTDKYIFIQTIPNYLLLNPMKYMYVINTEQVSRIQFKNLLLQLQNKNIPLIDYSNENVCLMQDSNMYHLPYQYNEHEISKLMTFLKNSDGEYDVAFVGHLSPKRQHIYDQLLKRGIKMLHINNLWHDDRDLEVAKAKILLNVHFADDYTVYETLRCDRWVMAGMIVVSEKSVLSHTLDINKLVVFEDYDKLVDSIVFIINNYPTYLKIYHEKYINNFQHIIDYRNQCLIDIEKKLLHITDTNMEIKNTTRDMEQKTLELFSANWRCNMGKDSFVKYGSTYFQLSRGFNIFGMKNNELTLLTVYDSCVDDQTRDIQLYVKNLQDKREYDYLIMITHDDAMYKTNPKILENYLIFIGCEKLSQLEFRGSYLLIYNLISDKIVKEICDNQFPIHEWFEFNDNTLQDLGIPVYIIVYNLLYFVKNIVSQLEKYTRNIHIIDNKSTYSKLLEYYDDEYKYFLDLQPANYGHTVWMKEMYWQFPRVFAISDPDLQFNDNLPHNFLQIMSNLTDEYKKGKVGFALDISDHELFYQEKDYTMGQSIYEWEKRFWLNRIDNDKYQLYNAGVDTTFCVVNKSYEETGNAIRMGGDFTCKHIPWYEGWHRKMDDEEWNFYKKNNISSGTVRMIMSTYHKSHKKLVKMFNDMDLLINEINKVAADMDDDDQLKFNINASINSLMQNKIRIAEMLDANCENL